MKFSILLIICQLIFSGKSVAQKEFPLKLILEESQNKFTPIEPISVKISLINSGFKSLEVLTVVPDSGNPYFEYLNENREWKPLSGSIKNSLLALRSIHPKVLISGNDTVDKKNSFIPYIPAEFSKNKKSSYPFLQKGKYKIRAVYSPSFDLGTKKMVSNKITIKIIPHKKKDEEAFEWLIQLDNPHFVYASINRRGYYIYRNENLVLLNQELIQKFPNSTFAEWARLNLIIFHSLGKKHKTISSDIKIGKVLFKELEAFSNNKLILKKLHELRSYTAYRQIAINQSNDQKLKLTLEIGSECFPYLEPLYYSILLANESKNEIETLSPYSRIVQPKVEIKVKNKNYWFFLKDSDRSKFGSGIPAHEAHLFKLHPITLETNQVMTKKYSWASSNYYSEISEYIDKNKKVQIRTFFKKNKTDSIFSNIVELKIKKYKGQNKKAEKWLQELKAPDFFYEFFLFKHIGIRQRKMTDFEIKDKTDRFIKNFPNSIFTPWIKLNLAYWHSQGFFDYKYGKGYIRKPDIEQALTILEELASFPNIEFQKERKLLWDSLQPEDNLDWLFEGEN